VSREKGRIESKADAEEQAFTVVAVGLCVSRNEHAAIILVRTGARCAKRGQPVLVRMPLARIVRAVGQAADLDVNALSKMPVDNMAAIASESSRALKELSTNAAFAVDSDLLLAASADADSRMTRLKAGKTIHAPQEYSPWPEGRSAKGGGTNDKSNSKAGSSKKRKRGSKRAKARKRRSQQSPRTEPDENDGAAADGSDDESMGGENNDGKSTALTLIDPVHPLGADAAAGQRYECPIGTPHPSARCCSGRNLGQLGALHQNALLPFLSMLQTSNVSANPLQPLLPSTNGSANPLLALLPASNALSNPLLSLLHAANSSSPPSSGVSSREAVLVSSLLQRQQIGALQMHMQMETQLNQQLIMSLLMNPR
jgi:hypothetical protein